MTTRLAAEIPALHEFHELFDSVSNGALARFRDPDGNGRILWQCAPLARRSGK